MRLFKSIGALGFTSGCWAYYLYARHRIIRRSRWSCRRIRLPNVAHPVWLRPGLVDWLIMESIFIDREYDPLSEPHNMAMDRRQKEIVDQGKTPLIIDCGANVGLSAVWLSVRFPDATVIAVEPERANFDILSRTAKNFANIIPVHAAISDRMSRVALSNHTGTPWAWRTQEADSGGVIAVTIRHLVGLDSRYSLMAVKVDIEGFEVNLFRDGAAWVDDLPLLVFEMHDWLHPCSGSGHAFFSTLSRHPRDYLLHGENVFSYASGLFATRA